MTETLEPVPVSERLQDDSNNTLTDAGANKGVADTVAKLVERGDRILESNILHSKSIDSRKTLEELKGINQQLQSHLVLDQVLV
jgi:hypothetical protein